MPKYVLSLILLAGSIAGVGCSEHHYNTYPPYYRSGGYYSGPYYSGPYYRPYGYRPGRVYRGDARYREEQRERYRREQRERYHDYRR